LVIGDIVRLRGGPDEVERAIVATARHDGRGVEIDIPQDPGQAGKAQVAYFGRALFGYNLAPPTPETGDKVTRAMPLASQVNVGNVRLVKAHWNRVLVDEMAGFPAAKFDDQVDALSRGTARLIQRPASARMIPVNFMAR
jgi:predicted phage terminase large subunit-like protein